MDVGIDGSTIIVGNPADDDNGSFSGSAYIYTPEPSTCALLITGALLLLTRRRSVRHASSKDGIS